MTLRIVCETRFLAESRFSNRNCLVIGVSLAFGLGTQFSKGDAAMFPAEIANMAQSNSVILTTLLAVALNLIFPKEDSKSEASADGGR